MIDVPSFRFSLYGFNRSDVLNYIKNLIDEKAALTLKLEQAKNELAENKTLIDSLQRSGLEASWKSDQELGRVMRDARRFSDSLVNDAEDKVYTILKNAADTTNGLNEQLRDMTIETENTSEEIEAMLREIRRKLHLMQKYLQNFNHEVEKNKRGYKPADEEEVEFVPEDESADEEDAADYEDEAYDYGQEDYEDTIDDTSVEPEANEADEFEEDAGAAEEAFEALEADAVEESAQEDTQNDAQEAPEKPAEKAHEPSSAQRLTIRKVKRKHDK